MAELRIGLIGCGGMGTHLVHQCATIPNVKITAACDIVQERADKLAEELSARSFYEHTTLLQNGEVDAVIVATPNDSHSPITVDCARAGKHIFCEKPMSLRVEDCDAMISAAESAGVKLMVGHVL